MPDLKSPSEVAKLIFRKSKNPAVLIGNGVNLCGGELKGQDWINMLKDLWTEMVPENEKFPSTKNDDLSAIEIYDLMLLKQDHFYSRPEYECALKIADKMKQWEPTKYHFEIVSALADCEIPILTTNFDELLARSVDLKFLKRPKGRTGFTDFYPWECCYTNRNEIEHPERQFGIWHVHGTINYPRSIRFGLSDYMGLVQRARGYFHGSEDILFTEKNQKGWKGRNTWLHIWFNSDLFIFGLALSRDEVFLRWMLLERERYFRKFPMRRRKAWYIRKQVEMKNSQPTNQRFLEAIGVRVIEMKRYEEMYEGVGQALRSGVQL